MTPVVVLPGQGGRGREGALPGASYSARPSDNLLVNINAGFMFDWSLHCSAIIRHPPPAWGTPWEATGAGEAHQAASVQGL